MIEELKRFITVVEMQSFTKAAKKLYITQPALSISVKKLEAYMHATLFESKAKNVTLSSEGSIVYDMGKKILSQWDRISDPSFRKTILGKKHIVLGAFDSAAIQMAPVFKEFSDQESFSLDITIHDSQTLWKQLLAGILDICICVVQKDAKVVDDSVVCQYTYEESLLPVASSTQWKHMSLGKIPFILYTQQATSRTYINDFFLKKNITPTVIAESTSTSFMKELAMQGLGVALLPKSTVAAELKQKALTVALPNIKVSRTVGVYVQKNYVELVKPFTNNIVSLLK